ncbi:MMPL family transporter [Actinoplanes sp. L3-i22]|uniref:MMPL family transporter n=1 Tax=Actinoplanes sp. L3-i22 TaxID=2836373 RepID=UPI001C77CAC2|nr:MMPL family transporter [Actinoplanes sp. L3-i22]BCY10722.1 membrane protein [Actinoplanes sp. L3-i22]
MTSLARGCFRWRFAVLGGWVAALVALVALTIGSGTAFSEDPGMPDSESATAYSLMAQMGAQQAGSQGSGAATESGTIVWHTGAAVDSAAVKQQFTAMLKQISALPGVQGVVSPYDAAGKSQINTRTSTAYATITVAKDTDTAAIETAATALRSPDVQVALGDQAFETIPGGSHGPEVVGLLAALVILFLVFRSAWAAALPIITGIVGVATSLLVVVLAAHVIDLASTSITMGALIGLGVGIDYALFIVNRYRKAMMAGDSVPEAIVKAVNTSGRAVVFAGLTVIVALLGMYVVKLGVLTGMAQAAAVTVLFTVAAAITLLPALLGILGRKVLSRRQRKALAEGIPAVPVAAKPTRGARWAGLVQRNPLRAVAGAVLAVVILASPVLSIRIGDADASSDPVGSDSRNYYELMAAGFGAGFDASLLLVAEVPDAASAAAFTALVKQLPSVADVASVSAAPIKDGQTIAVATVTPVTSAQTQETTDLVTNLRDQVITTAENGNNLRVYVGGSTASTIDLAEALLSKLPLYLGLIALLGFLLLAVAFRSLLVPLIGAISNIATILVGLGAVTAIFQFGWGTGLLGVGTGAPITYLVPVLVMGIMFGLSMDYQVFLVSRMHEEWTHTRDNLRSIRVGLTETAQVIAAAATIMLFVFASFGFSGERIVSMIGIGLAVAVLIDAFVVRMTLIPALMTLIGRANWFYPRWAEKITPKVSVEGPAEAPADHEPAVLAGAGHHQ